MATPPGQFRIEQPILLVVEGREDLEFWTAVFEARNRIPPQIAAIGGKNSLRANLAALVRTPGFEPVRWLGIIQDGDDDPRAAFQRIQTSIRSASLEIPSRSWHPVGTNPVVAAMVLPDGIEQGDLESLVRQAVGQDDRATCVETYFKCLAQSGFTPPRQTSKARVHAYLASLEPPDLRLGHAARRGLLPLDSAVLDRMMDLVPEVAS